MDPLRSPSTDPRHPLDPRVTCAAFWERDLRSQKVRWAGGIPLLDYAPAEVGADAAWWRERIHPDDRAATLAAIERALESDALDLSCEYRFRRKDGTWAHVVARGIIDRDEAGRAVRTAGVMMDATHPRETERALREAQRMLLEAQRIGQTRAWEEDVRGGVVRVDAETLFGDGATGYAWRPFSEAWALVHPDDRARLMELRRHILETGEPFETEYRRVRPDGTERVALVRGELVRDAEGRPERIIGIAVDITDRRRAEERAGESKRLLELVLDTLPVGVAVMDKNADIVMSNPASARIWGGHIATATPRYERSVAYWRGSGRRVAQEEWASQRALKDGETTLDQLVDIERFDGQTKTIRNSAAPIRDAEQRIVGAVVVNEDFTEQARAEEALGRRERQQAALAQLTLKALEGDDLPALFDEAVSVVVRTLDVDYGALFEWIPERNERELRATAGSWVEAARPSAEEGARSGLAVAIPGKTGRFGALEAGSSLARAFTEDEVDFIWSVANVLATSIARARAAAELEDKRRQMQALSRKLIEAQEAERRAIARELHDDFGQVLTALRLSLQRRTTHERENIELVDGAIARMRDLAQDLRPPQLDELGLEASLRWYVERETARAGLQLALSLDPLHAQPVPAVATTCFRVVQEALTNVVRHAEARRVSVGLRPVDGDLEVVVSDDGRGFDVAAARRRGVRGESQGLLGMQERVDLVSGELEIDSAPGHGTSIRARLPLTGGGHA